VRQDMFRGRHRDTCDSPRARSASREQKNCTRVPRFHSFCTAETRACFSLHWDKIWNCHAKGDDSPPGYDRLELVTAPDPQPGPEDVVVASRAIGVNYADCTFEVRASELRRARQASPAARVRNPVRARRRGAPRHRVRADRGQAGAGSVMPFVAPGLVR
jgi:hypothetical protein